MDAPNNFLPNQEKLMVYCAACDKVGKFTVGAFENHKWSSKGPTADLKCSKGHIIVTFYLTEERKQADGEKARKQETKAS